jgi:hypothetical protein
VVCHAEIIFDFVIRCSPLSCRRIFVFTDRPCQVLEKDMGGWRALFLQQFSALVFDGTCQVCLDSFELAWSFVMFRKSRRHSLPILTVCNQHEFRPINSAPRLESTAKNKKIHSISWVSIRNSFQMKSIKVICKMN